MCKATLNVPLFMDHEKTMYFTVARLTDLNCFPQLLVGLISCHDEEINK